LSQGLLGRRKRQFTDLAQTSLGLGKRTFSLNNRSARFTIIEHNQSITGPDCLSFSDGNFGDRANDLTADVGAIWCLDVAASNHALDKIAAHERIDTCNGAEQIWDTKNP
jgi:hypothetical protein